ncbi:MAG: O-antigen ligase family protein [Chloroflexi bacterium]|nr:O-antigen ligase family protein [Chloroflexota bacterium]
MKSLLPLEWWTLLLIFPAVLLVKWVWLLAVIPLFWLVRLAADGRLTPRTPLNGPLWLMLGMVAVSLWATYDVQHSLGKVVGLVWGIGFYWGTAATAARSPRHLWLGVVLLLLFGWGVIALGLIGTQWSYKFPLIGTYLQQLPTLLPLGTELFNPNQVAGVLLWVAPVAIALAVGRVGNWPLALLAWLTAAGTTAVLILTQSRGGLLGFGVGLGVMCWLAVAPRWRKWVLGGGLATAVAGGWLLWRYAAVLETNPVDNVSTLNGRLEIWSRALYGIQDFPFTGMGMNNFRVIVHLLYPLFTISPDVDIAHAHNHILQAALDLGLPGAIAYIALWLGAGWMVWRVVSGAGEQGGRGAGERVLAIGLGGMLAASFTYGLFDAVALGAKPGFIWWFALGLLAALHQQQKGRG